MNRLLKFKEFSEFLTRELHLTEMMSLDQELGLYDDIMEGGAYGHLTHPFEDMDLTMSDIHDMIQSTINGAFGPENFVQEKCLSPDSLIQLKENGTKTIKEIVDNKISDMALSFNEVTNEVEYAEILNWVKNESSNEWLEIELEDGNIVTVTPNHRMFVPGKGDVKAEDLTIGENLITVFS
jgi:hypothetical protein